MKTHEKPDAMLRALRMACGLSGDLASREFPLSCGCQLRFDNDGFIRWQQCPMHEEAEETLNMLKRCLWALKEERRKGERGWEIQIQDIERQVAKTKGAQ